MKRTFISLLICLELILIAFVALPLFQKTYLPDMQYESVQAYTMADCFVAGTQILMSDGTSKSIEAVKTGDLVLSYNLTKHTIEPQPVLFTTTNTHNEYMVITFTNGVTNTNTIEQPYYVKGKGWASYDPLGTLKKFKFLVQKLEAGDIVFSYGENTLKETTVETITKQDGYIHTYNLHHIKDTNTYFANGMLVHNKASAGGKQSFTGGGHKDAPYESKKLIDVKNDDDHPANACPGGQARCDTTLGTTGGELFEWPPGSKDYWWEPTDTYNTSNQGGTSRFEGYSTIPPIVVPPGSVGTIKAVGVYGNNTNFSFCSALETLKSCIDTPEGPGCADIAGEKGYLLDSYYFLLGYYALQQHDSTGVTWTDFTAGIGYLLTAIDEKEVYTPNMYCYKTTSAPLYVEGIEALLQPNETIEFLVGFGPLLPWFQVQGGGNSFAGGNIVSYIADTTALGLLYDKTPSPSSPGILSSVKGIDLSNSMGDYGFTKISTTNWNTNNAHPTKDWYLFFKQRTSNVTKRMYLFGGEKPVMWGGDTTSVYTRDGNLSIDFDWNVSATDSLVIQVDGDLIINKKITIANGGFLAFIVSGNIEVSPDVGTTYDSETPVVEGIYIARGTIKTGTSTVAATERFVGRGVFIADNILTQRNLSTTDHNKNTSADLFLSNPNLVMKTPEMLMDLPYVWEEVAP